MSEYFEILTKDLSTLLRGIGYQIVRKQRTHLRVEKMTKAGMHRMTIPHLSPLAPGTLDDILTTVSLWNHLSKTDLLEMLKK
mgnify:CR=1 FL=1